MKSGESLINCIYNLGNFVICAVGSILFLILTWYSFRYTQYMLPLGLEFPINKHDSMIMNLLTMLVIIMLFWGLMLLEQKTSLKVQRLVLRIVVICMILWIAIASFVWITLAERMPGSDQFYICWDASNFMKGEYTSLLPGYYCERYPQQLGMTILLELFFSVVGANNYFAFEIVSAILAPCIAFLGYCIVKEITESFATKISYCLCMSLCLPLIFYTSWVYGEISSTFFSMCAVYWAMRYVNEKKSRYLFGIVIFMSLAKMCRESASILIIAFGITGFLYAIKQKDKRLLVTAVCAVLVPYLTFAGIQQIYEIRSGYAKSDGLPTSAGIAVGLLEKDGRYGWDHGYEGAVYNEVGYNKEKADEIYRQEIESRMSTFVQNPSYAVTFFREKQLSQWNAPLYQSYYFGMNFSTDNYPESTSFIMRLSTDYFEIILSVCDRLQFVLYIGILLYMFLAVNRDSNMLQHVLAVMVLGGFFFTLIWEAKARYVFPYYIAMFPVAVLGYQQLGLKISCWRSKVSI